MQLVTYLWSVLNDYLVLKQFLRELAYSCVCSLFQLKNSSMALSLPVYFDLPRFSFVCQPQVFHTSRINLSPFTKDFRV